ncbi:hypothetical protein TCARB_1293 [Thermofilum adornatum 1505]|uniref:Uncharacterized protein n=1 Tax=Thermofilum adornatum 1505 TaxID=697581 RepID=A0A3G1A602_9CREN|nr:hypothetical protein [Thermofilum adornatum]AJB42339.1 hypothetical protein TCARB_1293 [Thermofilum adornatum 1505]
MSGSRTTCEKGYYSRRVAEVILRNATLEEIKNLSLEILIAEVSLKMRSCNMTDEEKKELQILLEDLENAKKTALQGISCRNVQKEKKGGSVDLRSDLSKLIEEVSKNAKNGAS